MSSVAVSNLQLTVKAVIAVPSPGAAHLDELESKRSQDRGVRGSHAYGQVHLRDKEATRCRSGLARGRRPYLGSGWVSRATTNTRCVVIYELFLAFPQPPQGALEVLI
jgi:hypothetical protein